MDKSEEIKFVEHLFQLLNQRNISYCILRNADEVEFGDAHDIDMTVELSRMSDFETVIAECAEVLAWQLHFKSGKIEDPYNIKCYHYSYANNDKIHIVHIDLFPTFTWNGYVLLENDILVKNIDCTSIYHKAAPSVEAVTKLFIRLLHKGYIKPKYMEYIKGVFLSEPAAAESVMRCFLSEENGKRISALVQSGAWDQIEKSRNELVKDIKKHSKRQGLTHVIYLIQKASQKTGVMVAFEGTDGSGKSTVINGLRLVLENTYPEGMFDYYHWRPGFLKKERKSTDGSAVVVSEPHAQKPYGKIKSFAKFVFFNMDYILGYWYKVRWQLAKGHLVVFDRYYYDYYMDKLRYRLCISDKTLKLFQVFIPKPDATFLLVGDAKVLYERKKEITIEAIQEQINSLIRNKNIFKNSIVVDVNQPIEKVIYDVAESIIEVSCKKVSTRKK